MWVGFAPCASRLVRRLEAGRLDSMALTVTLNGEVRVLAELEEGSNLTRVIEDLGFRSDRVAVELNGQIARRRTWDEVPVRTGDRLEVVHFVGGGCQRARSS